MKNKLFLTLIAFTLLLSLVSAVPPVTTTQNFETSYIIVGTEHEETLEQNKGYQVNFFVYNSSDGMLLDDDVVECVYFLAQTNGSVVHYTNVPFDTSTGKYGHWATTVDEGNFSDAGHLDYGIKCNSTFLGGTTVGAYNVTPTGVELDIPTTVILILILGLLSLFLLFSVSGIKNAISGTWLISYSCLTYTMLYLIIGFLYLLSVYYLWMVPIFESILYISWFVMGIGFLPFVIIIILYILGQEAKAVMHKDFMNQGYTRDEASDLSKRRKR